MNLLRIVIAAFLLVLISSCSTKILLKRADALYLSGRYIKSEKIYKKAYKSSKDKNLKAKIAIKGATCFDNINQSNKSASWYRKAINNNDTLSSVFLKLSRAQLETNKIDKAEENLEQYKLLVKGKDTDNDLSFIDRLKTFDDNKTRYTVSEFDNFNSSRSDFSARYIGADTNTIIVSSTKRAKNSKKIDPVTGKYFSNIYISTYSNEIVRIRKTKKGDTKKTISISEEFQWSKLKSVGDSLNSFFNDGAVCFNSEGNTMYFTSSRKILKANQGTKIYSVQKNGDKWAMPKLLNIAADSISVGHPSLSSDGQTMYFVSDMIGGLGGNDIWKVNKTDKAWSKPINLGKAINTKGNEVFPFIRENGDLYFSSDSHNGIGGLDIYKAYKNDMGNWTVENMKMPINSYADDFAISFIPQHEKGLFCSSRNKNNDDIFRFEFRIPKYIYVGTIKDEDNDKPLGNVHLKLISSNGKKISTSTNDKGEFRIDIKENTEYIVLATKENYLNGKDKINTLGLKEGKQIKSNLNLKPISKPIELPNILYDFGKWELRNESKKSLDLLVETLNDNPRITIELMSHTDYIGKENKNKEISQKRAQSVVDYLIEKNINSDRLTAVGKGESDPKLVSVKMASMYKFLAEGDILDAKFIKRRAAKEQDLLNQINRRTDFKVLRTDYFPGSSVNKTKKEKLIGEKPLIKKAEFVNFKANFYTIHIGDFIKGEIPVSFNAFKVIFEEEISKGKCSYTTEFFHDIRTAKKRESEINSLGIKASVVAYKNGKKD